VSAQPQPQPQAPTISTAPAEHLALDYEALRLEGIALLQRLTGHRWTDYNAHDPGITILEQLCYAITDLAYRISHDLPDLLHEPTADGEEAGEPFPHLFSPAQILSTAPVTLTDMRKVVLDVDGVRNAWIEPIAEPQPALYYHEGRRELSLRADDETAQRVDLRGLYRVLIEKSELTWRGGARVEQEVAQRLHACRNLCEEFAEVVVLDPIDARVHADVEIDAIEDPEEVLLEIYRTIADYISPTICFATLQQLLAKGVPIDEIYDGPLLTHGFIHDDEFARLSRRDTLHTSDLIQAIMGVRGVRAIRRIELSLGGGAPQPWSARVDDGRVARLVLSELGAGQPLSVKLLRERVKVAVDEAAVGIAYGSWLTGREKQRTTRSGDLLPSAGRDRKLDAYTSVQHHLPATYGVGAIGLPGSASPTRKAESQQLRAYLTVFDQILANSFAQLAKARELFAFSHAAETYFTQPLTDPTIGLGDVWRSAAPTQATLKELTLGERSRVETDRRHRFLNHLLARFSEQLTDYSLLLYGATRQGNDGEGQARDTQWVRARLAEDKAHFLREYPKISGSRGAAINLLGPPSADNRSGLGERLRLKLGLREADEESFCVIEHILLRPMQQDRSVGGEGEAGRIPLLAATRTKDPYSLQLSVVFPEWPARLKNPGFRSFVEQTVREETPAHLTVYIHWADREAWSDIHAARDRWLELRRTRALL